MSDLKLTARRYAPIEYDDMPGEMVTAADYESALRESAADKQRIAELEKELGEVKQDCETKASYARTFAANAEQAERRAERAESQLATRLKMFVWDGRGKYKVCVCAANVAEARSLALEEMSIKGDLLNMREHVEQEQPLIYHRANAEIALTESGETEELNLCLEAETKRRQAVESELAIARDLIERHKQEEQRIWDLLTTYATANHTRHQAYFGDIGRCPFSSCVEYWDLTVLAGRCRE